ncbi:IS200/IS605 family transposase [Sansalvadorimonas verongulae]|nr:IS200/IS605 family transposase [Sansalvadorimonas verongulae]MTI11856.1 IS200/IS605 family transposase [Sansalvadorimonas verongulae]
MTHTTSAKMSNFIVHRDHVYLLVSAPPNMAPSEIMCWIKGGVSSKLCESCPDLKRRYWGHHFWAQGYFCVMLGNVADEMIKKYLDHHTVRCKYGGEVIKPPHLCWMV